jgi:unsaturated rhamnogalacturonyl hydrolase
MQNPRHLLQSQQLPIEKNGTLKLIYTYFFPVTFLFFFTTCKPIQGSNNPYKKSIENALLQAMTWQEAHPIFAKAPTDWTNGAYYLGVVKAHQSTNNSAFEEVLERMAIRNNWQPWERYYHADDLNITYSYLYLYKLQVPNLNLSPTAQIINDHLYKEHAWKKGIVDAGKGKNEPDEKKILWWWCDALFMAPPVIANYAKQFNQTHLLKEMDKYYLQTYNLLFDKEEHLFYRDARFLSTSSPSDIKEKNGKKMFWSRGNGWVLAGLALLLADLPKDYANRNFYVTLFKEMAEKIRELQPEDGLWRTSLLSPESFNHGEVSGTGLFTFAIAWGINNGYLSSPLYKPLVTKAWKALAACQQADGKVGWVQNIGANPMPASSDSWQNFGTGAFMLAGSEVYKLR